MLRRKTFNLNISTCIDLRSQCSYIHFWRVFPKYFEASSLKVSRIAQQKNVRTCLPVKMICIRLEMLFRVLIWCCVAWKNAVERLGKHVHGKAYTRLGMLWTRRLPATYGLLNHCVTCILYVEKMTWILLKCKWNNYKSTQSLSDPTMKDIFHLTVSA